jgi:hypothetical protein
MRVGPITGTFIDEITYDIPSSNWTLEKWRRDLDNMQAVGIDTLVFIRGGFEDKSIFPSGVLGTQKTADDFAGFIFDEAEKRKMNVFFGLYISNINWNGGDAVTEIRKNCEFVDEVCARYGSSSAFAGWYIPQEVAYDKLNIGDVMRGLSAICKDKTPDKQVLISPFFKTEITYPGAAFTPERTYEEWDRLFSYAGGDIDICAFQDGTAPLSQMEEYYGAISSLCQKYGIHHWVNAETFERDVRRVYYPITFRLLQNRLEKHVKYAEKIITFEFSHFLSPQSIYPSARNLNELYREKYID